MLAFLNTDGLPVALEPELIESVEGIANDRDTCVIRTAGGREHEIDRPYAYVTGVIRNHFHPRPANSFLGVPTLMDPRETR